jgi:hypothetical protein
MAARQVKNQAMKAGDQRELVEEADFFQNFFAHFDIAELRGMRELEFFPKSVNHARIEVSSLVQQVEQLSGRGCVLIVGFETTGILNGDRHGQGAEVAGLLVGHTGSDVHSHNGEILSCDFAAENTTLRASEYLDGV